MKFWYTCREKVPHLVSLIYLLDEGSNSFTVDVMMRGLAVSSVNVGCFLICQSTTGRTGLGGSPKLCYLHFPSFSFIFTPYCALGHGGTKMTNWMASVFLPSSTSSPLSPLNFFTTLWPSSVSTTTSTRWTAARTLLSSSWISWGDGFFIHSYSLIIHYYIQGRFYSSSPFFFISYVRNNRPITSNPFFSPFYFL